jgi:Tat protein secretion system quality control protein TatD with DNase activity
MFVDTHANLFYPNFKGEIDNIIESVKAAQVDHILVPSTNIATCIETIDLCKKYDII